LAFTLLSQYVIFTTISLLENPKFHNSQKQIIGDKMQQQNQHQNLASVP
jgi:hypothetical protein